MSRVVTVPELLNGHAVLDIECLDRICLNGCVPALQVGGQVVTFLHGHLGKPVASPAVIEQIGARFRQAVARFAENNDIPMVNFRKGIQKADVMRPLLARAARTGQPQVVAIGCLGQVCDRWIYSACLCFGLDLAEQARSGFTYSYSISYSIYQAEYSRNLLFRSGGQMEDLFDRVLDRGRSRLDIPALRTIFGLENRPHQNRAGGPHQNRAGGPPAQEAVIERSQDGLTWFKVAFGRLQVKAYTKGEHALRFEATAAAIEQAPPHGAGGRAFSVPGRS
jgi:hypothetical protein